MVSRIMRRNDKRTIGSPSDIFLIIQAQSRIAQQSGGFVKGWKVEEKSTLSGMNFRDNSMKKDTQLNEGLSRTPLSSQRILAMHPRIHPGVIRRRPGAAG